MKKLFLFIYFSLILCNCLKAEVSENLEQRQMYGEIRTKWKSEWGSQDNHSLKTDVSLGFDSYHSNSRISIMINAATENGKKSIIFLDKAYLGYQFYQGDQSNFSLEVGRNKLDSIFDSKMQFNSYFNGVHFVYTFVEPGFIDFKLHGGPHIVDSSIDHYGWLMEAVWNKLADTPLTVKYSFTDWNTTKNPKESVYYFDRDYYFRISQITAIYDFGNVSVYGAYLYNHQEKKYNDGFYVGFKAGKIRKIHDFSFDINFQSTKKYLLNPFDNKSLGKGVQIKTIYALAERLNLEAKFSRYDNDNHNKLEVQAIYAW